MKVMTKVMAFFVAILMFFGAPFAIFSAPKAYADFDCMTLNTSSGASDKIYCQNQLTQIEAELTTLLAQQAAQKQQTGTLKGDVDYLNAQINALKAKIKAQTLVISELGVDIVDKTNTITSLSEKIDRENASLAQLLRNTEEFDNENILNLVLSDDSLSSFYNDLESYDSIQQSVKSSVDEINGVKTQTEVAKTDLQKQQNAVTDAKAELENAQQQMAISEANQQQLLAISKQKEAAYQQLAAQKKIQADKIKSALFGLAGVSQKIEFGTALQYADQVSAKLGVDPAFLLAIITQESNLGANVGQCYLTNSNTGAGVGKNTGAIFANVMHPTRDVPVFLSIASDLGYNAFQTAVSCPIAGAGGYGGAMGPAQFIPSTWQLFASRLRALLGYEANPWSPQDAFMASGMYLSDLGAIGTSASAQNRAACSYYGTKSSSCSYSRSVMKLKSGIQANIDLLQS
jgi:membrane-bound lytic murein transglycosylase B